MKCAIDKCGYTAGGYYGAHHCVKHDLERIESVAKGFYSGRPAPKPYSGLPESFWKPRLEYLVRYLTQKAKDDILREFDQKTGQQSVLMSSSG